MFNLLEEICLHIVVACRAIVPYYWRIMGILFDGSLTFAIQLVVSNIHPLLIAFALSIA